MLLSDIEIKVMDIYTEIQTKRKEFCDKFNGKFPNAIFMNKIGLRELYDNNTLPKTLGFLSPSDLIGSEVVLMKIYECDYCEKFFVGLIIR